MCKATLIKLKDKLSWKARGQTQETPPLLTGKRTGKVPLVHGCPPRNPNQEENIDPENPFCLIELSSPFVHPCYKTKTGKHPPPPPPLKTIVTGKRDLDFKCLSRATRNRTTFS